MRNMKQTWKKTAAEKTERRNENRAYASEVTASVYKIKTNIMLTLSDTGKKCKVIVFTSASPGEGKTTTCFNISAAFAESKAKVLIIDADMRKPSMYRSLQVERKDGLSDLLCGLIPLKKAIKRCENIGVDCITSGQIPPNPTELISSPRMEELIDVLSEQYDYIFIDTPPVALVTDASVMSKYADGVIVVVRQNYTIHEALKNAKEKLDIVGAKVLGYILNDVDITLNRYDYYRRYNYGYGYGYEDYTDNT